MTDLSFKCQIYGWRKHRPCSGTTDDGTDRPCQCQCHRKRGEVSFSLSAQGSQADVLASLSYQNVSGALGASALSLLLDELRGAPDQLNGTPLYYNVVASGHSDETGTSAPSLSISLSSKYAAQPKPTDEESSAVG
jgi:hypothetical protein